MTFAVHPRGLLQCRQANYRVTGDGLDITFSINSPSPSLAQLMKERGVTTAAYFLSPPKSASRSAQGLIGGTSTHHGDGTLVLGISYLQARTEAEATEQGVFIWVNSSDALPALKTIAPLTIPAPDELEQWRNSLPADEALAASVVPYKEQAVLMTVSDIERRHWLVPTEWDLGMPWPLARPDGSTMNVGTELDRMFKLIAAGLGPVLTDYLETGEQ